MSEVRSFFLDGPAGRLEALVEGHAYGFLRECAKPKLFVSGARDEFGPLGGVEHIVATAAEPKRLVRVPGVDHFFEGSLPGLLGAIEDWLRATLPGAGQPL